LRLLDRIGTAPDLEFDDAFDHRRVSTADLRGRPLLLRIWTRFPSSDQGTGDPLAPLESALHAAGAVVVTLACCPPDDLEAGLAAARASGVTSPCFFDTAPSDQSWTQRFGLTGTSRFVLVARDGRICALTTRAAILAELLARMTAH
jgi:hypothetical protein